FFFFQAEDGIRDRNVTGVQTCALPIYFDIRSGLWEFSQVDSSSQALQPRKVCVRIRSVFCALRLLGQATALQPFSPECRTSAKHATRCVGPERGQSGRGRHPAQSVTGTEGTDTSISVRPAEASWTAVRTLRLGLDESPKTTVAWLSPVSRRPCRLFLSSASIVDTCSRSSGRRLPMNLTTAATVARSGSSSEPSTVRSF